jgi:cytochrome c-type biogenesis protein CcmH
MWLYGYALRQAGDLSGTLKQWDRLLELMPEGSSEVVSLTEQINVVRGELGQPLLPVPTVIGTAPAAAPAPSTGTSATTAASAAADTTAPSAGLRVRVELDPALAARVAPGDVLYVFARADGGPPMPLAISRVTAAQLPYSVTLNDSMAMTPALTLSTFPKVIVGARISKSGNAQASSGDLQGFSTSIALPSSDEVRVVIADLVP